MCNNRVPYETDTAMLNLGQVSRGDYYKTLVRLLLTCLKKRQNKKTLLGGEAQLML
jgi:hypothetical protein